MNSNISYKEHNTLNFSIDRNPFFIFLFFCFAFGILSCEVSPEEKLNNDPILKQENSNPIKGGKFRIAESECYKTLFPSEIEENVSFKVISQMHDGLVALDPKDLSVIPSIAKKWEVNDAQTLYTFHLIDNAYFHDDKCFLNGKGKKITAKDFSYTFHLLCGNLSTAGYNAVREKILGASEYHAGNAETISGIKIINDSVLTIELIKPASSFIHLLASPLGSVISQEAFEAYGKALTVGAGPFIFGKISSDSTELSLFKNPNYYRRDILGNRLPYLDEIHFSFESDEKIKEELFSNRELDLLQGVSEIYLENFFIENQKTFMSREFMVDRKDVLATHCYEFNNMIKPFNDVKVRKAFNYAINKKKLIENTLDNQGRIGLKGIVPNIKLFKNYNYDSIRGYPYNPEKAAKLLSDAGYPNGENFPEVVLELNIASPTQIEVAKEIQSQLHMALNINITIEQINMSTLINRAALGLSQMNHFTWVSEYPSPADFLNVFYGDNLPKDLSERSWPNTSRYSNKKYDQLLKKAISTTDEAERYNLFSQAEKIMIEDAPVAVLWYPEIYNIYHSSIKNLSFNELFYYDFTTVYISK